MSTFKHKSDIFLLRAFLYIKSGVPKIVKFTDSDESLIQEIQELIFRLHLLQ